MGQHLMQGASSQARHSNGSWELPLLKLRIRMRECSGLHRPVWILAQAISQSSQPEHFSESIRINGFLSGGISVCFLFWL